MVSLLLSNSGNLVIIFGFKISDKLSIFSFLSLDKLNSLLSRHVDGLIPHTKK